MSKKKLKFSNNLMEQQDNENSINNNQETFKFVQVDNQKGERRYDNNDSGDDLNYQEFNQFYQPQKVLQFQRKNSIEQMTKNNNDNNLQKIQLEKQQEDANADDYIQLYKQKQQEKQIGQSKKISRNSSFQEDSSQQLIEPFAQQIPKIAAPRKHQKKNTHGMLPPKQPQVNITGFKEISNEIAQQFEQINKQEKKKTKKEGLPQINNTTTTALPSINKPKETPVEKKKKKKKVQSKQIRQPKDLDQEEEEEEEQPSPQKQEQKQLSLIFQKNKSQQYEKMRKLMNSPIVPVIQKAKQEILTILDKIKPNSNLNEQGQLNYDFYFVFPYFTLVSESNVIQNRPEFVDFHQFQITQTFQKWIYQLRTGQCCKCCSCCLCEQSDKQHQIFSEKLFFEAQHLQNNHWTKISEEMLYQLYRNVQKSQQIDYAEFFALYDLFLKISVSVPDFTADVNQFEPKTLQMLEGYNNETNIQQMLRKETDEKNSKFLINLLTKFFIYKLVNEFNNYFELKSIVNSLEQYIVVTAKLSSKNHNLISFLSKFSNLNEQANESSYKIQIKYDEIELFKQEMFIYFKSLNYDSQIPFRFFIRIISQFGKASFCQQSKNDVQNNNSLQLHSQKNQELEQTLNQIEKSLAKLRNFYKLLESLDLNQQYYSVWKSTSVKNQERLLKEFQQIPRDIQKDIFDTYLMYINGIEKNIFAYCFKYNIDNLLDIKNITLDQINNFFYIVEFEKIKEFQQSDLVFPKYKCFEICPFKNLVPPLNSEQKQYFEKSDNISPAFIENYYAKEEGSEANFLHYLLRYYPLHNEQGKEVKQILINPKSLLLIVKTQFEKFQFPNEIFYGIYQHTGDQYNNKNLFNRIFQKFIVFWKLFLKIFAIPGFFIFLFQIIVLFDKELYLLELITELAYCLVMILLFAIAFYHYWKQEEKVFNKFNKKTEDLIIVNNKKALNSLQKKVFVIFGLLVLLKCVITAIINQGKKFCADNDIVYNQIFDFCQFVLDVVDYLFLKLIYNYYVNLLFKYQNEQKQLISLNFISKVLLSFRIVCEFNGFFQILFIYTFANICIKENYCKQQLMQHYKDVVIILIIRKLYSYFQFIQLAKIQTQLKNHIRQKNQIQQDQLIVSNKKKVIVQQLDGKEEETGKQQNLIIKDTDQLTFMQQIQFLLFTRNNQLVYIPTEKSNLLQKIDLFVLILFVFCFSSLFPLDILIIILLYHLQKKVWKIDFGVLTCPYLPNIDFNQIKQFSPFYMEFGCGCVVIFQTGLLCLIYIGFFTLKAYFLIIILIIIGLLNIIYFQYKTIKENVPLEQKCSGMQEYLCYLIRKNHPNGTAIIPKEIEFDERQLAKHLNDSSQDIIKTEQQQVLLPGIGEEESPARQTALPKLGEKEQQFTTPERDENNKENLQKSSGKKKTTKKKQFQKLKQKKEEQLNSQESGYEQIEQIVDSEDEKKVEKKAILQKHSDSAVEEESSHEILQIPKENQEITGQQLESEPQQLPFSEAKEPEIINLQEQANQIKQKEQKYNRYAPMEEEKEIIQQSNETKELKAGDQQAGDQQETLFEENKQQQESNNNEQMKDQQKDEDNSRMPLSFDQDEENEEAKDISTNKKEQNQLDALDEKQNQKQRENEEAKDSSIIQDKKQNQLAAPDIKQKKEDEKVDKSFKVEDDDQSVEFSEEEICLN